jgi:hypothetical protein
MKPKVLGTKHLAESQLDKKPIGNELDVGGYRQFIPSIRQGIAEVMNSFYGDRFLIIATALASSIRFRARSCPVHEHCNRCVTPRPD